MSCAVLWLEARAAISMRTVMWLSLLAGSTVAAGRVGRSCLVRKTALRAKVCAGLQRTPRVLITDGLAQEAIAALQAGGAEVIERSLTSDELSSGALAEYDGVIIRSATRLDAKAISAGAAGNLRLIGRAGVGVDNINMHAASANGLWVLNTPSASTISVVELTLAHLLAASRQLPRSDRGLREGVWLKPPAADARVGSELSGKTLGLLGFGRIAQGVSRVARALGMRICATSPRADADIAAGIGVTLLPNAEALFEACTHVSVHCALTPETENLVGLHLLSLMPSEGSDGSACGRHLVNVARGGIVDEEQVSDALHTGVLTSYAADVFATEPLPVSSPLLGCPGFIGTPHIGGATTEAQRRVGTQLAHAVVDVLVRRTRPHDGVLASPE